MNVYYTFTSKPGHFLTVKIWENIIKYFVSTVCFPPEVDLHHPSLWLFLAQVVAIQTYFYNRKVLLITFLPFTLWQKIWHVMINFLFCICFYLILFYFLLLLLFYGRKYGTLWLIFYFVFVFILFYLLLLFFFLPGAAYRYSHFPAHGCLGESLPLQDKTSPELWVLGPWNNPENKTDEI